MKIKFSPVLALILMQPLHSLAQSPQIPDSLFGNNSLVNYLDPSINSAELNTVIDLLDGTLLFGGYSYNSGTNAYYIDMAKADYCGMVDSSFGNNGIVHFTFSQRNTAYHFQVQGDGKILVCGIQAASNAGSQQFPYVARFFDNGSPDTTFGNDGTVVTGFAGTAAGRFFAVRSLADGRVVVMGYNGGSAGAEGIGAMRFHDDGMPDNTFSGDGIAFQPITIGNNAGAGFITSTGHVIAVGATRFPGFDDRFLVMKWDSTGTADPSFGSNGMYIDSTVLISPDVYADMQPDGSIVLAALTFNGTTLNVHRIDPSGVPDPTFGTGGHVVINHPNIYLVKGVKVLTNGKILILGGTNTGFGQGYLILLNTNGSVDMSFGNQGFLLCDMNGNQGTHYTADRVEFPGGEWLIAGGGGNGLLAKRLVASSNVPHIAQNFNFLQVNGTGSFQWYLNGNPIPGAISNTLNFSQNGDYTVTITDHFGCSYLSDIFTVTNSSVADQETDFLQIFPNPAKDYFKIFNPKGTSCSIELYNGQGQHLMNLTIPEGSHEGAIDVQSFPSGMYFISVLTSQKISYRKILLQ